MTAESRTVSTKRTKGAASTSNSAVEKALETHKRTQEDYYEAKEVDRRLSHHLITPGSIVCDVGGGWGIDAFPFAIFGSFCICLDADRNAVRLGKSFSKRSHDLKARLEFVIGSATNLPFKTRSIDLITCFSVLDHLHMKQQVHLAISESSRAVKELGYVVVTFPNRLFIIGTISMKIKQLSDASAYFERRFTPKEMHKLMTVSGLTPIAFDSKYPTRIGVVLKGNMPKIVDQIPKDLMKPFLAIAEVIFRWMERRSWLRFCGARSGYSSCVFPNDLNKS